MFKISIEQNDLSKIVLVIDMLYPRIRNSREDRDLTQKEVGEIINVPQRTYAYYENGQRTIPPHVLCALAEFYHTSVDYLLGLTDEETPYPRKQR